MGTSKKCPKCGYPLYRGNEKIERREGRRSRRIHRACPAAGSVTKEKHEEIHRDCHGSAVDAESRNDILEIRMALATVTPEDDFVYPGPAQRYRYFLHPGSVDKLKKGLGKAETWVFGFASNWSIGIQVEIIPILEELVDAHPEVIEQLVEVKIDLGGE